jgi:beta-lactamase regulating signal transducer with metallopeptidase domain
METISRLLLVFLINALWQALVVILLASLCDRLMRNAPARFRHWLWVIALIICLGLPLSSLTGIGRPPEPGLSSAETTTGEKASDERLASANGVNDLWRRNFLSIQPAPIAPAPTLIFAVVSCYLLSLLCHLMKFRRAWRRTNEICGDANARDIPAPVAQVAARCRSAFGVGGIPIFSSASAPSPLTLGIFRPVIILPESLFDSASTVTLTSALGHEMAHIRRRDFGLNLIYELLCLPIAFHPAVGLVKRRINQTRELACDEMVTDQLMDARAYARSIVDLAALAPALSRPIHSYNQPLGVLDADILEERVMRLIEKKPRLSAKRAAALLIAASLTLTISAAAASAFSLSLSQDKGAKPNFSGKWKSESTVNEVGDMPFPPGYKGEMIDIDHKDPELKVIKTIEAGAKIVVELSYTTDGKEKANTWGNVPARSKINWNGKQMIISTSIDTGSGTVEAKEIWDLGDDQKTLIITREFQDSRAKMVCKRQ